MSSPQFTQTRNQYNDIRNLLLNDPKMQLALAKYMHALSNQLQTQINNDPQNMNEARAFLIMQQALDQFAKNVQTKLKQNFPPNVLTDADLRTAGNMTQALNNPQSIAGEQMRDTSAAIIESLVMETAAIEQAVIAQAQDQSAQASTASSNTSGDSDQDASLLTLGSTTSDAVKVFDHGATEEIKDSAASKVFEKTFGKEIKPQDVLREREDKAGESLFSKARVPTPQSFASKVIDKDK